jgi:hypothetical protein
MLLLVGWGSYRGARGQATSGSSGRAPGISDLGLLLKGSPTIPNLNTTSFAMWKRLLYVVYIAKTPLLFICDPRLFPRDMV